MLSLLYGPALTSVHLYFLRKPWKSHSITSTISMDHMFLLHSIRCQHRSKGGELDYLLKGRMVRSLYKKHVGQDILAHISLENRVGYNLWASQAALVIKNLPANSVQFSHSVMSDSLQPHERQHARPPCPSPAPGVYLNSCPLSR